MKTLRLLAALSGFKGVAVGLVPKTAASRLSGVASKRVARAPIRVFVYVAASKTGQETTEVPSSYAHIRRAIIYL